MRLLRINNVAIYKSIEFGLTDHNFDGSSKWYLHASEYYGNDGEAAKLNFIRTGECYYLPITPSELDSAYSIENYCEYRGEVLECSFYGEKNEFGFDMRWVNKEICEKFGLAHEYERNVISRGIEDTGLVMRVPDSEIQDVWEIHKPIEGFPFKGPEKVWVKKDGVWLR